MATSSRNKTVRVQQASFQGSGPRMVGVARATLLFLLAAVVIGGAVGYYLGRGDTEPSADVTKTMDQATESASAAADSAADAASSAKNAASNAFDAAEAVGDALATQADSALDTAGEATDSAGQLPEQAAESQSLREPDTSVGEVAEAATEPLSAIEAPTTPPAPNAVDSGASEPLATPAPAQTAPASEADGSETTTTTPAMTEPAPQAAAPQSTSASAGSETITVKPGEYLYSIARRVYGDASKWRLIYDANRNQLLNPDAVRVGMKLVIPAATKNG